MSRRYYLTIIMKTPCSSCDKLKTGDLNNIRSKVEAQYGIKVKTFNFVNNVLPPNSEQMPKDLRNYFYWMPGAVLVEANSYDAALRNDNQKILAYPFNLEIIPNQIPKIRIPGKDVNEVNILEWIGQLVGQPNGNYEALDGDYVPNVCNGGMGSRNLRFGV